MNKHSATMSACGVVCDDAVVQVSSSPTKHAQPSTEAAALERLRVRTRPRCSAFTNTAAAYCERARAPIHKETPTQVSNASLEVYVGQPQLSSIRDPEDTRSALRPRVQFGVSVWRQLRMRGQELARQV